MEIKEQSGLRAVLADVELPRMAMIRQKFPRDGIEDVAAYLMEKLDREDLRSRIKPGTVSYTHLTWVVDAPWLQRLIANVNFSDYESRNWFDQKLRQSGLFDKLEEMGIKDGDIVSMYDLEFEYQR